MEIVRIGIHELEAVADWLAAQNTELSKQVGYVGTDADDIFIQLSQDMLDGEETSMVAAKEQGQLVALIGLDITEDSAEVWGPFSSVDDTALQEALFVELKRLYPHIEEFGFYLHVDNKTQQQFVESLGATKEGTHLLLAAQKDGFEKTAAIDVVPYEEAYEQQVIALHDAAFPETYYDGQTIVRRASRMEHCYLLLVVKEQTVVAYSYFEVDSYTNEASLNYIFVADSERGSGVGNALLQEVIHAIFLHDGIDEILLSVNRENEQAFKLFTKAGFHIRSEHMYYHLLLETAEV